MKKIIAILSLLVSMVGLSQVNPKMAMGNQEYSQKEYAKAEAHYRESAASAKDGKAAVNMGNAIYREKNMPEAGAAYLKALQKAKTFDEKHRAYHNLGNVMMRAKDYQAAVDAYQNALRNNPNDEQTRYNYALARQYLKDNPPPKDKGDDKDKKKQPKEQEQKQNQPKPDDGDNKDQKAQPKPEPKGNPKPGSGLSKQRMQGILEAVNNEEKQVQQKLQGKKAEGRPVENGKDW
ncbi:MAG TPA: tetratricopeptide repeat protein [Flavobacterium sp.]|nr:tetratricopeptide repeat protein [Flavobacterium sp.]